MRGRNVKHDVLAASAVAALLAASAALVISSPESAQADVYSAPDPVGDGSVPAVDIVGFTAAVTSDVVGVHIDIASYDPEITGDAAVWAEIDLNGDDVNEFTFKRRPVDGSFWVYRGSRTSDEVACAAGSSPAGPSGIEMFAPASCLDNPSQARFGVYVTNSLHGYDYAGYWTPWLSPKPDDPPLTAPWPYITPSSSPTTSSPTPTTSPDTTAPTTSVTAPTARFQLAGATTVRWAGSDNAGGTGLAKFGVRYRRAPYSNNFDAWAYPATWQSLGATTRSVSATLALGYTYCFSVRAFDKAGNASRWSASRCTSRPLDDRSLVPASSNWSRGTGSVYFKSTFTKSKARGAKLTRSGAEVRRIALVATRCPSCGSVKVLIGATKIAVVDLYASTRKTKQLIVLPAFTYRTGRISIVLTTDAKPVIIDGIGISRA